MQNVILNAQSVHLSQSIDDPDIMYAKFIICDFDVNENEVQLNRNTIDSWKDTLIGKPLVGKIVLSGQQPDFSSHEYKRIVVTNSDGKKQDCIEFDTQSFGHFISCEIESIDGIEYIVATAEIWKRYSTACEIIQRRVNNGTLHTSWEVIRLAAHYEILSGKVVKVIDKGRFLAHCLLGQNVFPAYRSSKAIDVASLVETDDLYQAIIKDFLDISEKEGNILDQEFENNNVEILDNTVENIEQVESTETVEETKNVSEQDVEETTEQTTEKAIEEESEGFHDVEQVPTSQELMDKIEKASATILSMQATIRDLEEYKEKYLAIEKAALEQKKEEKQSYLKKYLEKSKCFTNKELESEEIATMVSEMKEIELKAMVSDRLIAKNEKEDEEVNFSEAHGKHEDTRVELFAEVSVDRESVMKNFLN